MDSTGIQSQNGPCIRKRERLSVQITLFGRCFKFFLRVKTSAVLHNILCPFLPILLYFFQELRGDFVCERDRECIN